MCNRHIFVYTLIPTGRMTLIFRFWIFADADRATSISMLGGTGAQNSFPSSHTNGNSNASNFYPENFPQFSPYPGPLSSEPHIRLQSPPHRLNHRNRNIHQNQQYETGTSLQSVIIIMILSNNK